MGTKVLFKLKTNTVKHQDDRADTCGFHAMEFLKNRFKGISFADSTGFNAVSKYEPKVQKIKKKTFGYI